MSNKPRWRLYKALPNSKEINELFAIFRQFGIVARQRVTYDKILEAFYKACSNGRRPNGFRHLGCIHYDYSDFSNAHDTCWLYLSWGVVTPVLSAPNSFLNEQEFGQLMIRIIDTFGFEIDTKKTVDKSYVIGFDILKYKKPDGLRRVTLTKLKQELIRLGHERTTTS